MSVVTGGMLEDLCPSCGYWVTDLNPETGWCFTCSPPTTCGGCGNKLPLDGRCHKCRQEAWLARNADKIERELRQGISLTSAIRAVRAQNRIFCVVCKVPIKGGASSKATFCLRTKECKTKKRRYRYLTEKYRSKGMTFDQAKETALKEL